MEKVKAIFDIGKTNKKFLLFDNDYNVVYQEGREFEEIEDDDGFACENIDKLVKWIEDTLVDAIENLEYDIEAVNFTTYGATLVYLDKDGKRVTPVYNYLKPIDEEIFDQFYDKYEGKQEFCRKTASPALGMLNSGLQIYWLKKKKPEYWEKVEHILHFPQYLSYLFTGKIVSEHTSIGCHTGMWNFDKMEYHYWLEKEGVSLPQPVDNSTKYNVEIADKNIDVGIGIHDSSASLVPFLRQDNGNFMLISSGTWAINMNPFNSSNLTKEQLANDCLCYLSVNQKQVKSSRFFMGHIHDESVEVLSEYYDKPDSEYKSIQTDTELAQQIFDKKEMVFFGEQRPVEDKIDQKDITKFKSYKEAYHQLMYELSYWETQQINRVIDDDSYPEKFYISGGFVNNDLFIDFISLFFDNIQIKISDIDNGTALGSTFV